MSLVLAKRIIGFKGFAAAAGQKHERVSCLHFYSFPAIIKV